MSTVDGLRKAAALAVGRAAKASEAYARALRANRFAVKAVTSAYAVVDARAHEREQTARAVKAAAEVEARTLALADEATAAYAAAALKDGATHEC